MYVYAIKISLPNTPSKWYVGASTEPEHREYWGSSSYIKEHQKIYGTQYLEKSIVERNFTSIVTLDKAEVYTIRKYKSMYGSDCINQTERGILGCFGYVKNAYEKIPTLELPIIDNKPMSYEQFLDCVEKLNYDTFYLQCMKLFSTHRNESKESVKSVYYKIPQNELPTKYDNEPIKYNTFLYNVKNEKARYHTQCKKLFNQYKTQ